MLRYVVFRCLYGEDFVQESIRSIEPYVDRIFVFWTDKVWGNATFADYNGQRVVFPLDGKFDGIRDRLCDLQIEFAFKMQVGYDHVVNNQNQFTHLVNDLILPKYPKPDTVIIMEVDHVWRREEFRDCLAEFSELRLRCASASQIFLWKTFEWQCDYPYQRPSTVFWNMDGIDRLPPTNRQGDISGMKYLEGHVHNLGYCVSEKVMRWKHLTALAFSRKIGDSPPRENWFEDVWKAWTPDMKNLEPAASAPGNIRRAVPYVGTLPEVLK